MREIKFRAWDKINNQMVLVRDITWENGVVCEINTETYVHFPLEKKTVELMQFTGLKDKNGKEIYEGDILKRTIPPLEGEDSSTCTDFAEVVYETSWGAFWAKGIGNLSKWMEGPFNNDFDRYAEVIGNIYENPELLEKKV